MKQDNIDNIKHMLITDKIPIVDYLKKLSEDELCALMMQISLKLSHDKKELVKKINYVKSQGTFTNRNWDVVLKQELKIEVKENE